MNVVRNYRGIPGVLACAVLSFACALGVVGTAVGDIREAGYRDLDPALPLLGIGALKTFVLNLDETNQTLEIDATVVRQATEDLPDSYVIVVNGGGMPSEDGELVVILFDGTNPSQPRISVAAYNPRPVGGGGPIGSFVDGSREAGIQPPDLLFSGDESLPEVIDASVVNTPESVQFRLVLSIEAINSHVPLYPSPTVPWQGISSDGSIGAWWYFLSGFVADYSTGFPTQSSAEGVGALDVTLAPWPYRPECAGGTTSVTATPSEADTFFIGQTVEVEAVCITPDGEAAPFFIIEKPDSASVSVENGALVSQSSPATISVSTETASAGQNFSVKFTCLAGPYFLLNDDSCEVDFSVRGPECVDTNNVELLATLDGYAERIKVLNGRIAQSAKRTGQLSRKTAKRVKELQLLTAEAQDSAWRIWVNIPSTTFECEAGPTVEVTDLSSARTDYVENVDELEQIGDELAKILKQAGSKKRAKRLKKRIAEQAEFARVDALNTPLSTATF